MERYLEREEMIKDNNNDGKGQPNHSLDMILQSSVPEDYSSQPDTKVSTGACDYSCHYVYHHLYHL